jgi:CRISPR-associated protein Cmr3
MGKPIVFGGWFNVYDEDKKRDNFPSRLFKLIPAGSVFYYKLEDENKLDKIFEKYWLKPSFFVPDYPYFEKSAYGTNPLGFGLSIIGVA